MTPLRIIFSGSGEFGLPTLEALLGAGHEIVHVFTQPDRPAGRGRKLAPTAIGQFALDHKLPVTRTDDINAQPLPPADLMVVIAFGQKISEFVTNFPRLGSVNLHASRLPRYRGAAPINWAVLNGETETGNSIIRLAQRMDAGAVLGMSSVKIGELETASELHDRLAADGAPLMLEVVGKLAAGTAEEAAQDESQATKAIKLSREASRIDWTKPAQSISRQIRGMYAWPGCRVRLLNVAGQEADRLTLVRARVAAGSMVNEGVGGSPMRWGEIVIDGIVRAGEGQVEVVEVQPEGKRPMPLSAYRNGHRWDPGMRLESIG